MSSAEQTAGVADRLRFARAYAADQLPWFSPALFRCRIVITEAVTVAAIDRHYHVYWNPVVVNQIWESQPRASALSELAFLWVHEISHRLRRHAERAEDLGVRSAAESRDWNLVCDLEINDSRWRGLRMPAAYPGRLPEQFGLPDGRTAETYLAALRRAATRPDFPIDEGSGVHGRPRPWELDDEQQLSALDEEIIRREVARRLREADRGGEHNGWQSWAREVLSSRVNWRQRLRHRMSVAVQRGSGSRIDYSFGRPNRRQSVYFPILPPTLSGDTTSRIAIVVDTSGSMQEAELARALSEVAAVLREFRAPVTIIPCDIGAYAPVNLVAAEEAYRISRLPGGGGTDLRAGIEAAVALRPRPDTVLVLTDGETPYPTATYAIPVVFGIFAPENGDPPPLPGPPWTPDSTVLLR